MDTCKGTLTGLRKARSEVVRRPQATSSERLLSSGVQSFVRGVGACARMHTRVYIYILYACSLSVCILACMLCIYTVLP